MTTVARRRFVVRARAARRLGLGAALVVAALAAGCSSNPGSSSPATPAPGSATTATGATPTTSGATPKATSTTTSTTVKVPAYNPANNARPDVTAGTCTDDPQKGWSLTGSVTNHGNAAHGFSIVVDFVTTPGGTVVATRIVNVASIPANHKASWTTTPGAAAGEKGLRCVIRQSQIT
jgi:hypothetical protein